MGHSRRTIGPWSVGAVGLGAMPMSMRGADAPSRAEATVHAAVDAGITFIDTADCYAPHFSPLGHNERLIAAALATYEGDVSQVLVATKGGQRRRGREWPVDGRPEWIRTAVEDSLQRLGAERIALYQSHRPDPDVPYADTLGAFRELVDQGKVASVGISNVDAHQLLLAHEILGSRLVSVQNRFGHDHQIHRPIIELCAQLGLAFLAYMPLGGMQRANELDADSAMTEVARKHGVTAQQVALAWELAIDPCIIPIPGASRPESVRDCAAALALTLDADDLNCIDSR